MNTLEAIFSFLILLSLIPFFMQTTIQETDTSHYQLKLTEDVWRILYLNKDLEYFNKLKMQKDIEEISELTSLCILIEEEDIASCIPNRANVVVKKIAFINGNPETITLVIGVE